MEEALIPGGGETVGCGAMDKAGGEEGVEEKAETDKKAGKKDKVMDRAAEERFKGGRKGGGVVWLTMTCHLHNAMPSSPHSMPSSQ